jgi:hypothetical protein
MVGTTVSESTRQQLGYFTVRQPTVEKRSISQERKIKSTTASRQWRSHFTANLSFT